MYITTNVVSSNPAHGEVYSIQHYVMKFASDLHIKKINLSTRIEFFTYDAFDNYTLTSSSSFLYPPQANFEGI